jgi:hypothetical protein
MSSQKASMLTGAAFFVAMFTFLNFRSGVNHLVLAAVKSIPAQYMSWCISRDLTTRIKANASRGIQSKIDESYRKDFGDTVNP